MKRTEEELTALLSNPDTRRTAFADLVGQYGESLYWKIRRMVLNHEDANDVLQNVFIKAWNNIDQFRFQSKISTWLYKIAINESLDFLRKQRIQLGNDDSIETTLASRLVADEYFDGDHAAALLQEAVAKLPDVQRTVFNMKYFEEMKYSEISQILNTSEGALKASFHLAVKKVTEYLKQNG